jgi:predicted enzyme related to lactoylglutathione lyase
VAGDRRESEGAAMPRVVHFEIHADDVTRAKDFYTSVFGWDFEEWGQFVEGAYWGIVTGPDEEPGINGGLLQRLLPAAGPGSGTNAFVCTVGVADYDQTHDRIISAGGQVVLPKMALAGIAWQGYYLDTEGNTFGIHQPDAEAR